MVASGGEDVVEVVPRAGVDGVGVAHHQVDELEAVGDLLLAEHRGDHARSGRRAGDRVGCVTDEPARDPRPGTARSRHVRGRRARSTRGAGSTAARSSPRPCGRPPPPSIRRARRALAARLLHPPGRPRRAGALRGRPHPQRPVVLHPAGGRPPVGRRHPQPGGQLPARPRSRPTSRRCRSPPDLPGPDDARAGRRGARSFERAFVPAERLDPPAAAEPVGPAAWMRVADDPVPDDPPCTPAAWPTCPTTCPPMPSCGPTRWAASRRRWSHQVLFTASLDHTIWFHRPIRADEWHLHDFTCHTLRRRSGPVHRPRLRRRRRPRRDRRPGGAAAGLARALKHPERPFERVRCRCARS